MSEDPTTPSDERKASFEELLAELEGVVGKLERGELPLEASLEAFERGMLLVAEAGAILDGAERRVEELIEERDGSLREVPLEEDA